MKHANVLIDTLYFDVQNPRIDPVSSQQDAIDGLVSECGDKIVVLARDIAEHGLNPTEEMLCVAYERGNGRHCYIVKEGNRRLLALKALKDPSFCEGWKIEKKIKAIAQRHADKIETIKKIPITIFADDERDKLKHWILVKHDGQEGGAGTVKWGAEERLRFSAKGAKHTAMQVVNWLRTLTDLTDAEKRSVSEVPITTLERILASSSGKDIVGLKLKDGVLVIERKKGQVRKNVLKIISDLTTPDPRNSRRKIINVNDVKTASAIKTYLKENLDTRENRAAACMPTILPIPSVVSNGGQSGETPSPGPATRRALKPGSKEYLRAALRTICAAENCGKAGILQDELVQMNVRELTLSFCIVFRSLLEISMLAFARRHGISFENGTTYKERVKSCVRKLTEGDGLWSASRNKKDITKALQVLNSSLFSITELHNLVHGTSEVASSDEILKYVPRIVPLIRALNDNQPLT